jgi:Holliday junction resolvase RusA-like endonuclease
VIQFFVPGLPRPEPRARTFQVNGVTRTARDPKCDAWKKSVRLALLAATPHDRRGAPLFARDAAVWATMLFRFERPKSHWRADGTLRDDARPLPSIAPDADNLAKAVLDAIGPWPHKKGAPLAWVDDCIVCALDVRKQYHEPGQPSGCLVTLEPLK